MIIKDVKAMPQIEFAKLRAFRAHVPYVTTCLRVSNYYVSTCLKLLRSYVPKCLKFLFALNYYVPTRLRAYVPSFFTCLYIRLRTFVLTYHRDLNYFVPTCAHFSRA